jgi:hypothetical protein
LIDEGVQTYGMDIFVEKGQSARLTIAERTT